jgi:hypothetical protein
VLCGLRGGGAGCCDMQPPCLQAVKCGLAQVQYCMSSAVPGHHAMCGWLLSNRTSCQLQLAQLLGYLTGIQKTADLISSNGASDKRCASAGPLMQALLSSFMCHGCVCRAALLRWVLARPQVLMLNRARNSTQLPARNTAAYPFAWPLRERTGPDRLF